MGTSIAAITQEQLDEIAAKLNGRPRQTLDWMTPSEKLHEVLRRPVEVAPASEHPSRE
jgi:IS30 family transposase